VVVLALAAIGIAAASSDGGGNSPSRNAATAAALARIHRRNLQLESILLLLERQGKPTPHKAAASPPHNASSSAPQPVEAEPPSEPSTEEASCDPNYEGACLDPNAPDYDCEGGSGDGPDYTGDVTVVGEDHFGLDRDSDGTGCEVE